MLMGSIAETDTKLIIFSQTFILGVSKKNHSPNYTQKMGRKMTSTMYEPFVKCICYPMPWQGEKVFRRNNSLYSMVREEKLEMSITIIFR